MQGFLPVPIPALRPISLLISYRNRNIDYLYIEKTQEIKSGFRLPHTIINT
jgi:hypothetical protein